MIVIGLTGNIGMGKSTAAQMLWRMGLPIFDADKIVHGLLAAQGTFGKQAVAQISALFPDCLLDGKISRQKLGQIVFADQEKLRRLEKILHPKIDQLRQKFLATHRRHRRRFVVLDMPLLFEIHKEYLCDRILVVNAPDFIQCQRVLARPGMTKSRFAAIRAQQWPSQRKCRLADCVLPTGLGKAYTMRQLQKYFSRGHKEVKS